MTVLQPDSNTPFSSSCVVGPPISDTDAGTAINNCTIRTTNAGNNGRWVRIAVNVPTSYTCSNDADGGVCWVRVRLNTFSRAERHDDLVGVPPGRPGSHRRVVPRHLFQGNADHPAGPRTDGVVVRRSARGALGSAAAQAGAQAAARPDWTSGAR